MKLLVLILIIIVNSCNQITNTDCNLEQYNSWIGLDINLIGKDKLPKKSRIIYPNQPITFDFVEDRINFKVSKKSIIKSISCG